MKSSEDWKSDSILIIAGEASSCMYAKNFIKQWRQHSPDTYFYGVGDREMASMGMNNLGFAEDMGVVGLIEVIKHFRPIKEVFEGILTETEKQKPRFALLLDYPGFNLRLAKRLKVMGVPVVYYISPQLWAWKKGRVKQVRDYVDDMMVVFPFEVDFYKEHGIKAHFVGHPLVEVVEEERQALGSVEKPRPVLGLMPGSRRSEIKSNFKNQWQAAKKLQEQHDLDVRVLLAPTLTQQDFDPYLQVDDGVEFVQDTPTAMIQACDYIISASGTATLQVALCEKPMVVMYRMNPITAFLAKLLVRSVDAFCIVNLIAGEKIVPELFQEQASPSGLFKSMDLLMRDRAKKEKMIQNLKKVNKKLGAGGATSNLIQLLRERYGS